MWRSARLLVEVNVHFVAYLNCTHVLEQLRVANDRLYVGYSKPPWISACAKVCVYDKADVCFACSLVCKPCICCKIVVSDAIRNAGRQWRCFVDDPGAIVGTIATEPQRWAWMCSRSESVQVPQ